MQSGFIDKLRTQIIPLYIHIIKSCVTITQQLLGNKKIVIISEKNISSIPVSFKAQLALSVSVLSLLLWISYSTGKYFAYENIISEKDKEIWTTSVTNENLQYQVSDLHKNLSELNKYFDNIREFNQASDKPIKLSDAGSVGNDGVSDSSAKDKKKSADQNSVRKIMYNIRSKVVERIQSLETVIGMTGVTVDQIAARNEQLKQAKVSVEEKDGRLGSEGRGGPYEPIMDDNGQMTFNRDEFNKDVSYLISLEKAINSLPLAAPLGRYRITSGFGTRVDPMNRHAAMHNGIDLVGNYMDNVLSPAPGRVIFARRNGAYGRYIEIDHGSGVTTRYGHLEKILVRKGQKIQRGQVIGLQGNTGRSTGTHLHYEVRFNNKAYNPYQFLKAGQYVF